MYEFGQLGGLMEAKLNNAMRKFNYLMGETSALYHKAALKLGMSDSVMSILYTILSEGSPCSIGTIRRLSGLSRQTINSALRKLESDGLIGLQAVDGKQKSVLLTEKGERLAEETVVKLIEAENRVYGAWSEEELSEYLRLTDRYLTEIKKEIDNL